MFGKLISNIIKVVTVPIDIAESAVDVVTGGDGSKESKNLSDMPRLSELRDARIPKCQCGNNLSMRRQEEGIYYCPACTSYDDVDVLLMLKTRIKELENENKELKQEIKDCVLLWK